MCLGSVGDIDSVTVGDFDDMGLSNLNAGRNIGRRDMGGVGP